MPIRHETVGARQLQIKRIWRSFVIVVMTVPVTIMAQICRNDRKDPHFVKIDNANDNIL